jgi:hypothetical protein
MNEIRHVCELTYTARSSILNNNPRKLSSFRLIIDSSTSKVLKISLVIGWDVAKKTTHLYPQ